MVKELFNGYSQSGMYTQKWHGDSPSGLEVASGMYIIHLDILSNDGERQSMTSKCIYLK